MAGADRDTTDLDQAVPFLPYQFEPEAGEDDSDTAEVEDRGNAERLTSLTWCVLYSIPRPPNSRHNSLFQVNFVRNFFTLSV